MRFQALMHPVSGCAQKPGTSLLFAFLGQSPICNNGSFLQTASVNVFLLILGESPVQFMISNEAKVQELPRDGFGNKCYRPRQPFNSNQFFSSDQSLKWFGLAISHIYPNRTMQRHLQYRRVKRLPPSLTAGISDSERPANCGVSVM
jgi:hypothetical protein